MVFIDFFSSKRKVCKALSLLCTLLPLCKVFGSPNFKESFIEDVRNISCGNIPIKDIFDYNEQKYSEILSSSETIIGSTTNFASVRVFYKKKSGDEFLWKDLPLSNFFLSTEESVGDFATVSRPGRGDAKKVLESYRMRGGLTFYEGKSGKENKEKGYNVKISSKNEQSFVFENQDVLKWSKNNPLYPDLIHSEQQFFNYYLLGNNTFTKLSDEEVDTILINIVSTNAACDLCYKALYNLLTNENSLKNAFLFKTFPKTLPKNVSMHVLFNSVNDSDHRKNERKALKQNPPQKIDISDGKAHFINTEFGAYLKNKSSVNNPNLDFNVLEEEIKSKSNTILNQNQLSEENITFLSKIDPDINEAFKKIKEKYIKSKIKIKKPPQNVNIEEIKENPSGKAEKKGKVLKQKRTRAPDKKD